MVTRTHRAAQQKTGVTKKLLGAPKSFCSSAPHLHGGHARIGPVLHNALADEPGQLALGQHRVHKGEPV